MHVFRLRLLPLTVRSFKHSRIIIILTGPSGASSKRVLCDAYAILQKIDVSGLFKYIEALDSMYSWQKVS